MRWLPKPDPKRWVVLLALLLTSSACSSIGSDGVSNGDPDSDESAQSNEADGDIEAGGASTTFSGQVGTNEGPTCGPFAMAEDEVAAAVGRLPDAVVATFEDVGLPLGAPERWSVVRQMETTFVVADPVPLSADGSSYWVRIVDQTAGSLFDGICDFGGEVVVEADGDDPLADGSQAAPSSCTVVADGFAITSVWTTSHPSVPVAVLRDGAEIHLSTPTVFGEGVADLLHARRIEHGELPPADNETEDEETTQNGFADLSAEPGRTYSYTVQAVGEDDNRSDEVDCGIGQLIDQTGAGSAPTVDGSAPSGALAETADDNLSRFQGPFQYVTLEPICATCTGTTVEIYLVPDTSNIDRHKVDTVWVDGEIESADDSVWLVDPVYIGLLLLEAEQSGEFVDWSTHQGSGLINQWVIGNEGARLVCLEVDTRPIDMRTDRCGRANLLG